MVDVQMTTSSHLLEIGFQKINVISVAGLEPNISFLFACCLEFHLPVSRSTDAQKMCV